MPDPLTFVEVQMKYYESIFGKANPMPLSDTVTLNRNSIDPKPKQ